MLVHKAETIHGISQAALTAFVEPMGCFLEILWRSFPLRIECTEIMLGSGIVLAGCFLIPG